VKYNFADSTNYSVLENKSCPHGKDKLIELTCTDAICTETTE